MRFETTVTAARKPRDYQSQASGYPPASRLVPAEPDAENSGEKDANIQRQRPVANVVHIMLDALLQRSLAAIAANLRKPRHAGLHLVPQHVLRNLRLELLNKLRSLRPRANQRHLPRQHVEQIR